VPGRRPTRLKTRVSALAAVAVVAATGLSGCGPSARRAAQTEAAHGSGPTTTVPPPAGAGTVTPPASAGDPTTTAALPTSTTPPPTTAAGPPFPVRTVTLPLVDSSRPTVAGGVELSPHRALTTVVWLPVGAGPRPLVVFGPGFDVGPRTYAALLEGWASHGYVVAAVEFPLADPAVAGAHLDESDLQNEPQDLRFVADSLVTPGGPVAGAIDAGRVAVAGHSDGGEAALDASTQAAPAGEPPFRAAITMSVQPLPGPPPSHNPPILFTQGDADTINPPDYGYSAFADASSPKYLEILHGGGHLPPLQDGSRWLPTVIAVTDAFLDAYLAGDGPASAITTRGDAPPLAYIRAG
jgi:hypothetical protein